MIEFLNQTFEVDTYTIVVVALLSGWAGALTVHVLSKTLLAMVFVPGFIFGDPWEMLSALRIRDAARAACRDLLDQLPETGIVSHDNLPLVGRIIRRQSAAWSEDAAARSSRRNKARLPGG